ncbi:MAG: ATP synthase F1 subunit delta [Clostridia bacterium]|nr:ATP synthase F1 subunit delta [Clostridia bacterium]
MTAIGNNYSEALFMLAREENCVDEFYDSLKTVQQVLESTPEYLQFLSTPSIPKSERTKALESAFEGKINTHVLSFLQLLCEHGKAEIFFECVSDFESLRQWASNTVVAVVKTAVELNDAQKQGLIKSLEKRTGKSVTLQCVIDSKLLGGISVELDGELIDGSVKNNLKRVREVISV